MADLETKLNSMEVSMLCKRNTTDPLMKSLLEKGVNLVHPPSNSLEVGGLIVWEAGDIVRPADWEVVVGHRPKAEALFDDGYEGTSFETAAELNPSIGASFLSKLFGKGTVEATIEAEASRLKSNKLVLTLVAPAYQELKNLDLMLEELGTAGSEPQERYKDRKFFVITRTWRAKGFTLSLQGSSEIKGTIGADVAEDISGKLGLSYKANDSGDYAFKAEESKIFGVTLRQINFGAGGIVDKAQQSPLTFRESEDFEYDMISDDLLFALESLD